MRKKPYDITGNIIAFESGELDREQIVELFQHLINTGIAWSLQGSYGRAAVSLIESGECTPCPMTEPFRSTDMPSSRS